MAIALAALLLAFGPAASSRAADTATTKPKTGPTTVDPASLAKLNEAVAALSKEYNAALKDKSATLRESADYFKPDDSAPPIQPEAVLSVLQKRIAGPPRMEAYIKWQLLSAVKDKFPDALAQPAAAAYRAAPMPVDHPGLRHGELDRALLRIGQMKQDNLQPLTKEFDDAKAQWTKENQPILNYRRDLFAKQPPGPLGLSAALEDVFARLQHGAELMEFWDTVASAIKAWISAGSVDKPRAAQLAQVIAKLVDLVKDERYQPYNRLEWVEPAGKARKGAAGLVWKCDPAIEERFLTDVVPLLQEASR